MKGGKSIWVSQRTLTDVAIPPFKARMTCAGIVIHTIYACSIV